MDLSSLFGDNPWQNMAAAMQGGIGVYGALQGRNTASGINQGVQQNLSQNNAATQAQIDALNGQIAQSRQQAQDMYQRSLGDVTSQNQGLQGNIDTMTSNLNALSDPNSAYMQQARQAIERKDAAAGRNSQWGDRETQLAAALAENVSKYSPGLQSSITGARNQISQNNQGLANLYNQAQAVGDRETMTQLAALQQQLLNSTAMNTTGREAANRATNAGLGALQQGVGGLGGLVQGLSGLWGSSNNLGISDYFGGQASQGNGITGYGTGMGSLYGDGGAGSVYDNQQYGYGSLPAGNYFGGAVAPGLGGAPLDYSGYTGGYQDTANNIDDWSFWS